MSRRVFSAEQVANLLEPLIAGQQQVAEDTDWEFQHSDEAGSSEDHERLAAREYEAGRLAGMIEAATLLGRAYLNGIDKIYVE